jgi:hypothetical protein
MIGSQNYSLMNLAPSADGNSSAAYLIYDWFHDQFPVWNPAQEPQFLHGSQTLRPALIPEFAQGPAGMVHFKNVNDPLCVAGGADPAGDEIPWTLLVLSPFEEFFELDPRLEELSLGAPHVVIWRPDRPTAEESARLRVTSLVPPVSPVDASRKDQAGKSDQGARHILSAVYVSRGVLIIQGIRYSIQQEIGHLSLQQYLSACLRCVAATVTKPRQAAPKEAEQLALRWAGLLSGTGNENSLTLFAAEAETLSWAATHLEMESGILSGGLQPLPEPFLTTRFRNEAQSFDAALERVRRILQGLRRGDEAFIKAMVLISQTFGGDEERILHWRNLAEDLPSFWRWLPGFETAYAYLGGAFPSTSERLESLRSELNGACAEPHCFLAASARTRFDIRFDDFKSGYIEFYATAHEDTVQIIGNQEKMRAWIDAVGLRNLELLSRLKGVDRSHLNRVHALWKEFQGHQCEFPVREILSRQPRCYCNFHPTASRRMLRPVRQINPAIQCGIDHCRLLLREKRSLISQEIKCQRLPEDALQQIAALLSDGPIQPPNSQTIDILNAMLQKPLTASGTATNKPPITMNF